MTDEQIWKMLEELLNQIDYDLAKQYNEDTAEEPEFVEGSRKDLIRIVRRYIK